MDRPLFKTQTREAMNVTESVFKRAPPPRVRSAQLFNGRREIIIEHGAEEYRLRLTGGGKLLLTK